MKPKFKLDSIQKLQDTANNINPDDNIKESTRNKTAQNLPKRENKKQVEDAQGRVKVLTPIKRDLWRQVKKYAKSQKLNTPEALESIIALFFNQGHNRPALPPDKKKERFNNGVYATPLISLGWQEFARRNPSINLDEFFTAIQVDELKKLDTRYYQALTLQENINLYNDPYLINLVENNIEVILDLLNGFTPPGWKSDITKAKIRFENNKKIIKQKQEALAKKKKQEEIEKDKLRKKEIEIMKQNIY